MPTDRQFDQATAWIARLRDVEVSDDSRGRFADWLHEDPAHGQAFDQMMDLWDQLGVAAELEEQSQTRVSRRSTGIPLALAAGIIAAAVALTLVLGGGERFETAHGQQTVVDLDDGSRVVLNTDSALEVDLGRDARYVEILKGQAFFDVAANPGRPFVVHTDFGTVEVVGTAFAVHERDDEVLVTVSEGRVLVVGVAGESVQLSADQQVRLSATSAAVAPVDANSANAWHRGQLVYDGVPLRVLIEDLNRYLPRKMTIADPELAATRVSAVLTIQDQTAMLEALRQSLPLRWSAVSENLIIIQTAS